MRAARRAALGSSLGAAAVSEREEAAGPRSIGGRAHARVLAATGAARARQSTGWLIRGRRSQRPAGRPRTCINMHARSARGAHIFSLAIALAIAWLPHADHAA